MHAPSPASRVAVLAARLLGVAAAAAAVAAVALALLAGQDGTARLLQLFSTPEPVVAPSFAAAGVLLVDTPASRRLGWLLLGVGLSAGVYVLAKAWALAGGDQGAAHWLRTWSWLPALLLVATVLPQVLPDGRPLPGWWRVPWAAALTLTVVTTVVLAVPAGPDDPFAVPGFPVAVTLLVLVGAASLAVRVRRADPIVRRQLAWVAYALVAAVLATFVAPWWLIAPAVVLVPAALVVAALRYRLYAIDLLVDRTLVGLVLLAGTAVVYAAVVAWAGALLGERQGWAPVVAAFAAALAFAPAQARVSRAVERLLHGERGDPLTLLTRLDRALASAAGPRQALHDGAAAAVAGLRVQGLRIEVDLPEGGAVTEQVGRVDAVARTVPLVLHGRDVGRAAVAPRRGATALDPADERVLPALAGRLAAAAYAVRLAHDVEESRGHLVTAREEERRRLRRDLHDGLGPQLSAVVMTLDTAASALRRDDGGRALALVAAAGGQAKDAVQDVRRLVHGLRPPALDDLGLLGALQAGAAAYGDDAPRVTIESEGDLPALPAALEVAVLRIAQEALANVVRHAGATQVRVMVSADGDAVRLHVVDDGRGIPDDRVAGVGLTSMRERAAELGGSCTVTRLPQGGTEVSAVLPRPGAS